MCYTEVAAGASLRLPCRFFYSLCAGDYVPTPNENDEITSSIGDNADGVVAGKKNQQQSNQQTVNVNLDTILLHLVDLKIEISEIKQNVEGVKKDVQGTHEERATLINDVAEIKRDRYPRWFQFLIIALAITMIVLVSIFLAKVW